MWFYLGLSRGAKLMENLLFFGLGFISFKLVMIIYISTLSYIEFKRKRSIWVKPNFRGTLTYDKRLVK